MRSFQTFPLVKRGNWIDLADTDMAWRLNSLLVLAETSLLDAAISLFYFDTTRAALDGPTGPVDPYARRAPFLFARSFLFALDMIGKTLRGMGDEAGVPLGVKSASAWFSQQLPGLVQIRDSAHHADERAVGEARRKPVQPKPILGQGGIMAPGGAHVMDHLTNSTYGCTSADGEFLQVDVTAATAEIARAAIQQAIDALPWR
jgi:hypothetical protein